MAVIKVKQDTITRISSDSFINAEGDAERLMDTKEEPVPCDAVPNDAAQVIALEDGQVKQYSYTIKLKPGCPDFALGDRVKLTKANGETKEAEVLGFHRYQLHAKMWI